MKPTFQIICGDALDKLRELDSESVQTCVTSPPYFGLRDYGIDEQLGLEDSPELYVSRLVEIMREVRRVLRNDGTLWLNLGDSYAATGGDYRNGSQGQNSAVGRTSPEACPEDGRAKRAREQKAWGIKPKDLIGIPWMAAFALRADGWYLRSDIIWNKPSCMPESVTDRPTRAHEYIFLLTKSARYYYDAEAIAERKALATVSDYRSNGNGQRRDRGYVGAASNGGTNLGGADGSRNKRTVWTVNTQPFKEAHFAAFPPELIKPCILAGSKEGDSILDPFCGAGTTGLVSLRHSRNFIGIELNPEYVEMARRRIYNDAPLLYEEKVA